MKKLVLLCSTLLMLAGLLLPGPVLACENEVDYSFPANGATNVDVNTQLRVRFYNADSANMLDGRIDWDEIYNNGSLRITLRQQGTTDNLLTVASFKAVTFDDLFAVGTRFTPTSTTRTRRYEITPPTALLPNTTYILTINRRIDNYDGCKLDADKVITFTTGAAALPPATILDNDPDAGATNVLTNLAEITVKFDQQVDSTNSAYGVLNPANFTISPNVAGNLVYDAAQAMVKFQLAAAMTPSTTYTMTLKDVKDLNGNFVRNGASNVSVTPFTWTFTTKSSDATPPTASILSPTTTTSIPITQSFQVQFSEAMDQASITAANLYINGVTSTVSYDALNFIATITPNSALAHSTDYTLTVSTGVRDASLNTMLNPLSFSFTTIQNLTPAAMNDYCQIPPFISGATVKPNVLLLVDNSGSMNEFAYKTKGYGDSNYDTSYDTNKVYYGYFDYNKMYQYDTTSGGFFKLDSSKTLDNTSFWSGNFLNWLTMRRVDVVRKVLTGGKILPRSLSSANYALIHDGPDRDYYKRYSNNYYIIDDGKIYYCGGSTCNKSGAASTYNGKLYVGDSPPEEGLLIKMQDQINFGIMFFNNGSRFENSQNNVRDGGYVAVDLGSTGTNLVTQVQSTDPSTWTPLGEALYEATHYFMATTGPYNNTNYGAKDPISHTCQKNFVLILTDGESTKDQNLPGGKWGTPMTDSNGFSVKTWMDKIAANEGYTSQWDVAPNTSQGSYYLEAAAYWGHVTDLRSATLGKSNLGGMQNVTTYAVYAFDDSNLGRDLLQKTCKYGGFEDTNGTGKPDATAKWDRNSDGVPDTYFEAQDGSKVEGELRRALLDILTRVSSGTAASILNNSEGSGASLLQAVFYPRKGFDAGTEVSWIGEMQNLWYYLDPYLQLSSIRVDTVADNKLNLLSDYIAQFYFDGNQTLVRLLKDVSGNGTSATDLGSFSPDDTTNVRSLWRAGRKLWSRDLTTDDRSILTRTNNASFDSVSTGLAGFTSGLINNTAIQSSLQAANATEAQKIINYIRGIDQTGFRPRAATIAGANGTWRLGDIVSSTPKIQANVGLNAYDKSSPTGYNDSTYDRFINSNNYKNRGMAYVGANDGMLHAFRMGVLNELTDPCRNLEADSTATNCLADKAEINDYTVSSDGSNAKIRANAADDIGKEEWAFVPRQMFPYLKYFADPDYPHLFYVDGTPLIVDVAINQPTSASYSSTVYPGCTTSYWLCPKQTKYEGDLTAATTDDKKNLDLANTSWRTILIGGTGLGGASRSRVAPCAGGGTDCVKTPTIDPTDSTAAPNTRGLGYSSYFALDITNPLAPKYLWEFPGNTTAANYLGFASTGPVVVRVGDKDKNGRWFAVFASGPTGPINTTTHQFMGRSDQNLKLFIVDMVSGALVKTIDTGLTNAFAGSVSNSAIDTDRAYPSKPGFYQDDAAYIGYVQKTGTSTEWTSGGVIRLVTNESLDPNDATKPWTASPVITGVGPVTSAVTKLQDRANGKLWLYFGAGRYFYKDASGVDDSGSQRAIYGVQDPCYSQGSQKVDASCTTAVTVAALKDQSDTPASSLASTEKGWYINLDDDSLNDGYSSERVITDPVASPNGVVYFTTFRPTNDVCGFGGNAYIWAVGYNTGAAPPTNAMQGKLMVQVSTGAFAEVPMDTGFHGDPGDSRYNKRRTTDPIQGVPPKAQGLSLLTNPKPVKKILQVQEK